MSACPFVILTPEQWRALGDSLEVIVRQRQVDRLARALGELPPWDGTERRKIPTAAADEEARRRRSPGRVTDDPHRSEIGAPRPSCAEVEP